jgi:signal transduction histidine kinase
MTTGRGATATVRIVDGTWWGRLRRVDHRIWDALLAFALLVLGVLAFASRMHRPDEAPEEFGFGLIVVAAVALAWRRRTPLTVAVIVAAVASIASILGYWPEFALFLMIALYSAAANVERRRLLTVLIPVALVSGIAISSGEYSERGLNWVEIAFGLMISAGIPILVGRMTFNRRRRVIRDRELAAREAVTAERAAIARELHDVVAHHMSVMVVQAGAARTVVNIDPAAAADALRQIEASGRTGLVEMRRLLEILKAGDRNGDRAPQPGLERLDELLEGMRATGLPVEAIVEGDPRPLPPGVDLSAYRIVQEALTNTLRHASGASARVLLRYRPDALEVEVVDDGRRLAGDAGPPGHGLMGMRERVQLFGGGFEAGPRPGGGWVVRARLPSDAQG